MKNKFKTIAVLFLAAAGFFLAKDVSANGYDVWTDQGIVYTAPIGDAYYPSVLYSADGFGAGSPVYGMWYSNGSGGVFLVKSADGVTWSAPIAMVGLAADVPNHAQVVYDENCFGVLPCSDAVPKYRIWYWRSVGPLYSIAAIGTARSLDGVNWIDSTILSQDPTAQLVTGAGTGWNRGSYGPINIFYQPDASNAGIEPWDYSYVMYYDGTNGSNEETGLAYSVDGLNWAAYPGNPVMAKSTDASWDCTGAVYGTVYNDQNGYHLWYSGGGGDNGTGGCAGKPINAGIGYASSADGKNWVRNIDPIFSIDDGYAYRSGRTYTPSVVTDGASAFKMYYTAKGSDSRKSIGLATAVIKDGVFRSKRRLDAKISAVNVVINDSGGTKTVSDFPLLVNGLPVVSGVLNIFPAPSSAYAVSQIPDPSYVQTFSGDCDSKGRIGLSPGDVKICIITNNDLGPPLVAPPIPPLIDLVKVPSPLALPGGPGYVTYTYTLRNIGAVPVTDITMTGDACSPVDKFNGDVNYDNKLDVAETWKYTCSIVLYETTTNTVVATGWANGLSAADVASATVVVGVPVVPPLIHVVKVPDPLPLNVDGVATFTETITNPGLVALSNVKLDDENCSSIAFVSGDKNNDLMLDMDEEWKYVCWAEVISTAIHVIVASGQAFGLVARDFAFATVVAAPPVVARAKTIAANLSQGASGSDVTLLQKFLINQNNGPAALALAKAGVTSYFGGLTRAALVEYQVKAGIDPASGYFGPLTRTYINAQK